MAMPGHNRLITRFSLRGFAGEFSPIGEQSGSVDDAAPRVARLVAAYRDLNRCLLMRRLLILDSSVERAIPSRAAGADWPETRPPLSASAASIIFLSRPSA